MEDVILKYDRFKMKEIQSTHWLVVLVLLALLSNRMGYIDVTLLLFNCKIQFSNCLFYNYAIRPLWVSFIR